MSADYRQIQKPFTLIVNQDVEFQILIADLNPGFWHVCDTGKNIDLNFKVEPGKNTIFFKGGKGEYYIAPGRKYELFK